MSSAPDGRRPGLPLRAPVTPEIANSPAPRARIRWPRWALWGLGALLAWGGVQWVNAANTTRSSAWVSEWTPTHAARAAMWSLEHTEWTRYETLMDGVRGAVSASTISPIEVLGIHARSDAERAHYARRWAALMHEDTERVLAFDAAYREAIGALTAGQPAIALGSLGATSPLAGAARDTVDAADRLWVFVDIDACDARCRTLLTHVVIRAPGGLDVYAVGVPSDATIGQFAQALAIAPAAVRSKRVTLNRDDGLYGRLFRESPHAGALPRVVRQRGKTYAAVSDPGAL